MSASNAGRGRGSAVGAAPVAAVLGAAAAGRFNHPVVEVLFDRICRGSGTERLLTQSGSPTTSGKIERFHRSMRAEFLSNRPAFAHMKAAQHALDECVA